MFASVKQIFSPKNKDLQKKILFTLLGLFIFKLGTLIIVPGIDKESLTGQLGFLELLNVMGGGAMERFSIFALGVGPYMTASIIIQLLSMDIIPYLSELNENHQAIFKDVTLQTNAIYQKLAEPLRELEAIIYDNRWSKGIIR